jgi:hypothetical protein
MACQPELLLAHACVTSDSVGCSPCFAAGDSFMESFANDVEVQFRTSLAFVAPVDAAFCGEANGRVCKFYQEAQVRVYLHNAVWLQTIK